MENDDVVGVGAGRRSVLACVACEYPFATPRLRPPQPLAHIVGLTFTQSCGI